MKFKCTTTETKRIGASNVFDLTTFTVEAATADEACALARPMVQAPFTLFFVIEDKYGPEWKPEHGA
jgi:hypothetical protein